MKKQYLKYILFLIIFLLFSCKSVKVNLNDNNKSINIDSSLVKTEKNVNFSKDKTTNKHVPECISRQKEEENEIKWQVLLIISAIGSIFFFFY